MTKNNIDWENFAKELLWQNIVHDKNADSLYDINTEGDIRHWRICSCYKYAFHPLTWKQLALALGLFEEYLTPDGHNCSICPKKETCKAFFKDDKDQERCSWWEENMIKKAEEK